MRYHDEGCLSLATFPVCSCLPVLQPVMFTTAEVFSIELCVFLFKDGNQDDMEFIMMVLCLAAPQFLSSYLLPHDFLCPNGGLRF